MSNIFNSLTTASNAVPQLPQNEAIDLPDIQPRLDLDDISSGAKTNAQRMAESLQKEGAQIRTVSEFYSNGGHNIDLATAGLNEYWNMSISAVKGLTSFMDAQDAVTPFMTEELYQEIVAPAAPHHKNVIMGASSEEEARKIASDIVRQEELLGVRNIKAAQGLGEGGAFAADIMGTMTDPLMWVTGFGSGAAAMRATKMFTTASKAAGATIGGGMMGATEAITGYAYASLAQQGNPLITDQEKADWAIWGGAFGAVIGGVGGTFRAIREFNRLKIVKETRFKHSEQVLRRLGPDTHTLFNRIVNSSRAEQRTAKELLDAELELMRLQRTLGTDAVSSTRPVTEILEDLSPESYADILDEINTGLQLREAERYAEYLTRRAHNSHALSMSDGLVAYKFISF